MAGGQAQIAVTFSFAADLHQTRQDEYFFAHLIGVSPDAGGGLVDGFLPAATLYPVGEERDGLVWYSSPVTLRLPLDVDRGVRAGRYRIRVEAGYQLCNDDGLCFFPQRQELTVVLEVAEGSGGSASPLSDSGGGAWDVLRLIAMAFIGGLILNVMPCVLPVLSIKALDLVRQRGHDRVRVLLAALSYALGILVSFVALAAVVVALKASGELVGWGFQFQNPGYLIALLAVVFVFSLSLFDVFAITIPVTGLSARASAASGYLGSFLTGTMAVLLATPCTAPFLGTALGYAFSQPPGMIFLIFAAVGLGLASPFVLLGLWPSLVHRIPKPGAWTGVFRTLMGFLLVGTAIFLLDVLVRQIGGAAAIRVVIFLAVLAFSAWLYGRFGGPTRSRAWRWGALAAAVAVSVAGGILALRFEQPRAEPGVLAGAQTDELPAGWEPFSPDAVQSYGAKGVSVFLAFGAQWCWTCRVNESTVLAAEEVRESFAARGVRLLYGDFTRDDEVIEAWLRRFGRAGVPLYVYFDARGGEPVLLPEILTRRMVLGLLQP